MTQFYSTDFMIDRAFNLKNIDSEPISIFTPNIIIKNRKTIIVNFNIICKNLNRDSLVVQKYLNSELQSTSSINKYGQLLFDNIFSGNKVPSVLNNYVNENVICSQCKSKNTIFIKEQKLYFVECKNCFSKITQKKLKKY